MRGLPVAPLLVALLPCRVYADESAFTAEAWVGGGTSDSLRERPSGDARNPGPVVGIAGLYRWHSLSAGAGLDLAARDIHLHGGPLVGVAHRFSPHLRGEILAEIGLHLIDVETDVEHETFDNTEGDVTWFPFVGGRAGLTGLWGVDWGRVRSVVLGGWLILRRDLGDSRLTVIERDLFGEDDFGGSYDAGGTTFLIAVHHGVEFESRRR